MRVEWQAGVPCHNRAFHLEEEEDVGVHIAQGLVVALSLGDDHLRFTEDTPEVSVHRRGV